MREKLNFYIDGKWVDPVKPALLDVIDPSTEEAYTQIAVGSAADVDRAVAAARAAFASYSRTTRKERLDLLRTILAEYNKRRSDVGDAISREMGAPLQFARDIQAGRGTAHLEQRSAQVPTGSRRQRGGGRARSSALDTRCKPRSAHRVPREDPIQGRVHVVVGPTDLALREKATVNELTQVLRGRDARDTEVTLDELDLRVRVREQVVDQVLAVEGVTLADSVLHVEQRLPHEVCRLDGVARGLLDSGEHVYDPLFPRVMVADRL